MSERSQRKPSRRKPEATRKGLLYGEGDCFAVPLAEQRYALGLIARGNQKTRVLFGYFFALPGVGMPQSTDAQAIRAADAILVGKFGDLDLHKGRWKIIGRMESWVREEWPFGPLGRVDSMVANLAYKIWYADDDPKHEIRREVCAPSDVVNLPETGIMGAGFVASRLSRILRTRI